MEMASAFGTIANKGSHVQPTAVVRVTDAEDELVYEPDRTSTRAISEKTAATLAGVLHEVYDKGTGVGAKYGRWGAVKTGTAQSWRDAWIVGYADDLATAVWIGYPQAQVEMTNVRGIAVTGGSYPAQVWKGFMQAASIRTAPAMTAASGAATATVAPAAGYTVYRVCAESLKLARPDCPETMDLVLKQGQMSTERCEQKH